MSDTWGTLNVPVQAGDAARGYDDPTIAGGDAPPDVPSLDLPAAGGLLEAESTATMTDPHLTRRYCQLAAWCGGLVIAIACSAVVGWLTGSTVFASMSLEWSTMKVNTAIGLIAAGCSLCLNVSHTGDRALTLQMSRLCAVFIIVLAGATLIEYVLNIDLGIDRILVDDQPGTVGTVHPGRMAPLTAMSFEVCGLALLTMTSERSRWRKLSATLALLLTIASALTTLGYLFGASEFYTVSGLFSAVAVNTSIALILLGVGIQFANLPAGPLRSLASGYLGGIMLRRMLPVAIVLPIATVWMRLIAQSAGLFNSNGLGGAAVAAIMVMSFAGFLVWYAGMLDRLDRAQRGGEEQIKQLNAALKARVVALEAANREFQGFSYSMSHVLRAPLRAIHGYADIILEELREKLDFEGRRLIGVIQSSTVEMSELLDGILGFLRLGWQPMTIVPVDMNQHVREVIELLKSKTAGRTIQFKIGDLPAAQADASMVRRIWLNLLDNAIKFTSCRDEATIEIGARRDGDKAEYFVKDNGAGFEMQYVAKLFGVFQRLHDATQFPGTGIGLAIVNRIVTRHGGRVWAESEPGQGATFYFSLPLMEKTHG
jgi:signal transduction histidine kinase